MEIGGIESGIPLSEDTDCSRTQAAEMSLLFIVINYDGKML
jgi:hypothetical protein